MQNLARRPTGQCVGAHELLIGRPLLLELPQGVLIDDGARLELKDQNIQHDLLHHVTGWRTGLAPAGVNACLHRGGVYRPDAVASIGICMSMHDFSRQ
jgi:hypothetical protein